MFLSLPSITLTNNHMGLFHNFFLFQQLFSQRYIYLTEMSINYLFNLFPDAFTTLCFFIVATKQFLLHRSWLQVDHRPQSCAYGRARLPAPPHHRHHVQAPLDPWRSYHRYPAFTHDARPSTASPAGGPAGGPPELLLSLDKNTRTQTTKPAVEKTYGRTYVRLQRGSYQFKPSVRGIEGGVNKTQKIKKFMTERKCDENPELCHKTREKKIHVTNIDQNGKNSG